MTSEVILICDCSDGAFGDTCSSCSANNETILFYVCEFGSAGYGITIDTFLDLK